MTQSLFVIPSSFFEKGTIKCDKYTAFDNAGVFMNERPDKVNMALSSALTGVVLMHEGKYLVWPEDDTLSLCSLRYITREDSSLKTIENSIKNHVSKLNANTTSLHSVGYIFDIVKYKNKVFLLFTANISNHNFKSVSSFTMEELVDKYFQFNDVSKDIINFLYDEAF